MHDTQTYERDSYLQNFKHIYLAWFTGSPILTSWLKSGETKRHLNAVYRARDSGFGTACINQSINGGKDGAKLN